MGRGPFLRAVTAAAPVGPSSGLSTSAASTRSVVARRGSSPDRSSGRGRAAPPRRPAARAPRRRATVPREPRASRPRRLCSPIRPPRRRPPRRPGRAPPGGLPDATTGCGQRRRDAARQPTEPTRVGQLDDDGRPAAVAPVAGNSCPAPRHCCAQAQQCQLSGQCCALAQQCQLSGRCCALAQQCQLSGQCCALAQQCRGARSRLVPAGDRERRGHRFARRPVHRDRHGPPAAKPAPRRPFPHRRRRPAPR